MKYRMPITGRLISQVIPKILNMISQMLVSSSRGAEDEVLTLVLLLVWLVFGVVMEVLMSA